MQPSGKQLPIHNTLIPKIKCLPVKQSWTAFSSNVDLTDVPTGSSRLTTNLKSINKQTVKWQRLMYLLCFTAELGLVLLNIISEFHTVNISVYIKLFWHISASLKTSSCSNLCKPLASMPKNGFKHDPNTVRPKMHPSRATFRDSRYLCSSRSGAQL